MGKLKKTQKFVKMKRVISARDPRVKRTQSEQTKKKLEFRKAVNAPLKKADGAVSTVQKYKNEKDNFPTYLPEPEELWIAKAVLLHMPLKRTLLFISSLTLNLVPLTIYYWTPILLILDIIQGMMDCLYAKCVPVVTDCVMGELEKMGPLYRVALRIVRDPRFERVPCTHAGTYADDCLVQRVSMHRCYIVATCDRDLKRRIRKIPGVPVMYIAQHKYSIERMPDAIGNLPRV